MKRLLTLLLPLALVPAWAGGFFDDFDGEDLGEHWFFGNPKGGMIYSVHDSLLEVYGFTGPVSSREWISALLPRYVDFDLQAVVGWTDAPFNERLIVALDNGFPEGPAIARISFRRTVVEGQVTSTVHARFLDGPEVEVEAPRGGFHSFRMTRTAGVFSAYLNDELILRGSGSMAVPGRVTLLFGGDRALPVDLLVDRVSVVPEPASLLVLAAGAGSLLLFRRWRTR